MNLENNIISVWRKTEKYYLKSIVSSYILNAGKSEKNRYAFRTQFLSQTFSFRYVYNYKNNDI